MTVMRRIEDAGEKIEGARKDWKVTALNAADLETMTGEEIALNVKKDNLWPKPDYQALIDNGMDPLVAAVVKIVRDRLSKEPRRFPGVDDITMRRYFVEMAGFIRDACMEATTVDDLTDVVAKVTREIGHWKQDEATRLKWLSVFTGKSCPFQVMQKDIRKAHGMLAEGFPVPMPSWKKGVAVLEASSGAYTIYKDGVFLKTGFTDEDAAWTWLKSTTTKSSPKSSKPKEPKRPHLDNVRRENGSFSLDGRDVSPEDFINDFGFRGVQFGNWLPDSERQAVLNMGYEALMDLADVLECDPSTLSLDGTLAVAFGARGAGGKHAAHYEPGQRVINMTRMNGAGSLAHEFAHALDHWFGSGGDTVFPGGIPSGSGWHERPKDLAPYLRHRDHDVVAGWVNMMKSIKLQPKSNDEVLAAVTPRLKAELNGIARVEKLIAAIEANEKGKQPARTLADLKDDLSNRRENVDYLQGLVAKAEKGDAEPLQFAVSEFSRNAAMLGPYWQRPNELFARAFECWVYDTLQARDQVSDYLVYGVEESRFDSPEFKGNPYPKGDDRERINSAASSLVEAMRASLWPAVKPTGNTL